MIVYPLVVVQLLTTTNYHLNHEQIYSYDHADEKITTNFHQTSVENLSTIQWLSIMIPITVIPAIIIGFAFYKKSQRNDKLKKMKAKAKSKAKSKAKIIKDR